MAATIAGFKRAKSSAGATAAGAVVNAENAADKAQLRAEAAAYILRYNQIYADLR